MSEGDKRYSIIDWRAVDWLAITSSVLALVIILWAIGPPSKIPISSHPHDYHHAKETSYAFAAFFQAIGSWSVKSRDYIDVWSTFAVALFTALLFASTWALWSVTRKTLDHAERTSERELRAYFHVVQDQLFAPATIMNPTVVN
jgi:hypothetical protein